ncbi:hypothetical protein FLL45_03625 [Aliikangiella marina]|uniref:ABC transporter substrate-binding protein n=1 Tax=Aliikangiella marina TaxID=1712262 RepID=A0A545TIJ6_9GAMM|nr:ABC transporter substrate binding protein [Aliikangiella marina]TQV77054.1 hypothetical protein FLL45_03625 [Aliikangiella marina]
MLRIGLFCAILLMGSSSFAQASSKIAVFYPQSKEPYHSIYREIIDGVRSDSEHEIIEQILDKKFDINEIVAELKQEEINQVIALGRIGYQLAKQLPSDISAVSGALPFSPNGVSGISLISEPANLFDYLRLVAPEVKTIHVAYSARSAWIIDLAQIAANERNLNFNAKMVANTADAIAFYTNLFDSNISKNDAIWLPVDRVSSHDKVTLPIILEKAWSNEVVVFSSKPSHAKRGALFSTYPNNFKLGQRLAGMVNELANTPKSQKFSALKDLQLAVNLRTAAHLGLKYSSEQQQSFKLVFPE